MVVLETRERGEVGLSVTDNDITAVPLRITLKEAWYEAGFHVTHYIIADEHDASGPMVHPPGITGQHRRDFLYGAGGVPMQGTGLTLDNRYVRYGGGGGGFHNNAAGPLMFSTIPAAHIYAKRTLHTVGLPMLLKTTQLHSIRRLFLGVRESTSLRVTGTA